VTRGHCWSRRIVAPCTTLSCRALRDVRSRCCRASLVGPRRLPRASQLQHLLCHFSRLERFASMCDWHRQPIMQLPL